MFSQALETDAHVMLGCAYHSNIKSPQGWKIQILWMHVDTRKRKDYNLSGARIFLLMYPMSQLD